ncbi:MAG: tRNA pseudouridine(54/55) synthase Pus10 [Haloarculaceae archaeon]
MDVLAVAREARETGPLCEVCLGRLVADRSFGLTNGDRGHSLRVAVALAEDLPYEEPAEHCWVCEDESGATAYEDWAERALAALRGYDFDTYQVGTVVPPLLEENDLLLREEVGLPTAAGDALKAEFNREVGKRIGDGSGTEVDFERPDVQVLLDLATGTVEIQVNSAFVYGRYRKLERDIPQTEWPCSACNATGTKRGETCPECDGTGYRYDTSVEQLVAPVVRDAMDGSDAVFHGAGREDVDARMLGGGRPFVVEVKEPRSREVDPATLQAAVNDVADGTVEVEGLAPATYEMVERVKEHDASKRYRMDVTVKEPVGVAEFRAALDALAGATVHQETPQRVDHRRASKTRTRKVYATDGELLDANGDPLAADRGSLDADGAPLDEDGDPLDGDGGQLETDAESPDRNEVASTASTAATVEVHGEGGLYVKELVSGDDGRTTPSLAGELGVDARVAALDVLAVTGEDGPFEHPDYFRSGVKDIDPPAPTNE